MCTSAFPAWNLLVVRLERINYLPSVQARSCSYTAFKQPNNTPTLVPAVNTTIQGSPSEIKPSFVLNKILGAYMLERPKVLSRDCNTSKSKYIKKHIITSYPRPEPQCQSVGIRPRSAFVALSDVYSIHDPARTAKNDSTTQGTNPHSWEFLVWTKIKNKKILGWTQKALSLKWDW